MRVILLAFFSFAIVTAFSQQNINMPSGTNTATHTTCTANFYDTGGSSGNHGVNQLSAITFIPASPGLSVRIEFSIFSVGVGATLLVFDGMDNNAPQIATYNEMISPLGQPIVASSLNTSGALHIVFVSGSQNGAGWAATVSCRAPCQSYNVQVDPVVTTKPIVEGLYMNVCKDSCITFGAEAVFLQNNINYEQTQENTMFVWRFGYSIVDTQRVVTKCFTQVRGWDYTLYAIDTMGCFPNTMYKGRIRVADNPINGIPPLPDACSGNYMDVYVGSDPLATIQTATVGSTETGTLSEAHTVFLPDGNNTCYNSDILFDIFNPGQMLTDLNHLKGVRLNMEHSYLGDISIRLQCPSGQSVILKAHNAGNPMPMGPISNPCSVGGGGIDLGCAPNPPIGNPTYNTPGIGWEYEFRPGYTTCFGSGGPTVGYHHVDQIGQTWTGPALRPSVPNMHTNVPTSPEYYGIYESIGNLLNCPLNGNWRITICDHIPYDNGYIFSWSLSLDPSIVPGGWQYNVDIDTVIWGGIHVIPTSKTSAQILLGEAGDNVYDVKIIDEYGCEYDTSFHVLVIQSPEPNINGGLDTAKLCEGQIIILNAEYEDPDAVYWWNTGATTDEIMALVEGWYLIEITATAEGSDLICTGKDSIYVSINDHPLPDFYTDPVEGCAPMEIQFTNETITNTHQFNMYEWRIYNFGGQEVYRSYQVNPKFFIENPDTYHVQLIVKTPNGCTDSIVKWNYLKIYPQPIAEFSHTPEISLMSETGGEVIFTNYCDSVRFAADPNTHWYWNFGDGTVDSLNWNPTHTYSTWGDYDVVFYITTVYGCSSSIAHRVVIEQDLEFPNVITPNGDGLNDVFAVKNLNPAFDPEDPDRYRENVLQIFDRWGRKVYEALNYNTYMKDDDLLIGTQCFDAIDLQDGQYYFSFYYKGKMKVVEYSGSLLIVREK